MSVGYRVVTVTRRGSQSAVVFFTAPPTTDIYTLSLHDALPICTAMLPPAECPSRSQRSRPRWSCRAATSSRSEEHTSELQSRFEIVCRLLLEKKKTSSVALVAGTPAVASVRFTTIG